MAWQPKRFADLGKVCFKDGSFFARVQFRDNSNAKKELKEFYGPRRDDEGRSEADLKAMRAAGAVGKTREEGLTIMAAEARRIQESAKYEAEIRVAMLRQSSTDSQDADDVGEDAWMNPYMN